MRQFFLSLFYSDYTFDTDDVLFLTQAHPVASLCGHILSNSSEAADPFCTSLAPAQRLFTSAELVILSL